MRGRYGGPMVLQGVPSVLVPGPSPKVGHSRSATFKGFVVPSNIHPNPCASS